MNYVHRLFVIAAMLLLSTSIYSCGGGTSYEPVAVSTLQNYVITTLLFTGSPSEASQIETEVHIVDASTNKSILCSGVDNGLQVAQSHSIEYTNLDANFIRSDDSTQETVGGFYITVLERDNPQCPGQPVFETDTTMARSGTIGFDTFQQGTVQLNNHESGTISFEEIPAAPESIIASQLTDLLFRGTYLDQLNTGDTYDPKMEVHLVDVLSNTDMACFGGNSFGLETINEADTDYTSLYSAPLLATDINASDAASWLRVVVIERADESMCPDPFEVGIDRIVSTSGLNTLSDLTTGEALTLVSDSGNITFTTEETFWTDPPDDITVAEVLTLVIDDLKFVGDDDESSSPEIEVHIEDPSTNETIACAGASYSLSSVTMPGATYTDLGVGFDQVWTSSDDPKGYVRIIIVDRDLSGCPTAASRFNDDYLDEIVMRFEDITSGTAIEMANGGFITFE
ncbi:MAG: hypothetical protein HN337_02460 [Deltaproteobacteria bacterium]|nr:hypothetical protein [Deltaproteobacteria bacterium]